MRIALQILGMVLLVLGAQGLIRVLVDTDDTGLLGWLPGATGVVVVAYAVLLVGGAALARRQAHAAERTAAH